jgi:hypothetical protein
MLAIRQNKGDRSDRMNDWSNANKKTNSVNFYESSSRERDFGLWDFSNGEPTRKECVVSFYEFSFNKKR